MTSGARNSILIWVVGIGAALGAWALINSGVFDEKDPCAIEGEWVEKTGVVIWGPGEHGSGWGVFFEMETAPPFSKENYPEQVLRDDPIAVYGTYGPNPMRIHSDEHGLYAFGKWSGIMGKERDDCPVFFGENGVFQIEGLSDLQILKSPDPLEKPDPGSSRRLSPCAKYDFLLYNWHDKEQISYPSPVSRPLPDRGSLSRTSYGDALRHCSRMREMWT